MLVLCHNMDCTITNTTTPPFKNVNVLTDKIHVLKIIYELYIIYHSWVNNVRRIFIAYIVVSIYILCSCNVTITDPLT